MTQLHLSIANGLVGASPCLSTSSGFTEDVKDGEGGRRELARKGGERDRTGGADA